MPRLWFDSTRRQRLWQGAAVGSAAALIVIVLWGGGYFESLRLWFSDLLYAPSATTGRVVIVAIDDPSLSAYGRTVAEWSRKRHAELLDFLSASGARVVGFDVVFAEPTADDAAFADAISRARDNGTRTVVAVVGRDLSAGQETLPKNLLHYDALLQPPADLAAGNPTRGHVNVIPDLDNRIRWIPLAIQTGEDNHTWVSFSTAMYLSYLRIPEAAFSQVVKFEPGKAQITPQRNIPVDSAGRLLTNFYGPPDTFPVYSYRAVLEGDVPAEAFQDKIVLVGLKGAAGATDRYYVPTSSSGSLMAGVEIHANVIETLIQDQPLVPFPGPRTVAQIVVVSLVVGMLYSQFRWYWVVIDYVPLALAGFAIASLMFSTTRQVVSFLHPFLALTLTSVGMLMLHTRWETQRRHRSQRLLQSITRLDEQRLILTEVAALACQEASALIGGKEAGLWVSDIDGGEEQVYRSTNFPLTEVGQGILQSSITNPSILTQDLILEQHRIGTIAVQREIGNRRLSGDQARLYQQFARQIAPVIANSLAYTERLRQNELLEAILGSTLSPICVLDASGALLRANPAATKLFGTEGSGQLLAVLLTNAGLDAGICREIGAKFSSVKGFQREIAFPGGRQMRTYILQAEPLRIAYPPRSAASVGKTVTSGLKRAGWVINFNDVTTLAELDLFKTQMIRMASHDLKSPLSVILGFTELLRHDTLSPDEMTEFLQIIDTAGKQMQTIITDILNVERARAGRMIFEEVDLAMLIQIVIDGHQFHAIEREQTLTLEMPKRAIIIEAERQQMVEALNNLVNNAIKYTPNGGKISVTVEILSDQHEVRLTVADNGYGIPKHMQEKLFQPFFRAKTQITADIPGTGLGLSLVKAVIEGHGGKIWVVSDEGKGSTFYVTLPLEEDADDGT